MTITEADFKLIIEIKKEGREMLWQLQHVLYKNNTLRSLKWNEIGEALGLTSHECMAMWKRLKGKYSRVKANLRPKDGTFPKQISVKLKEFIREMSFFEAESDEETDENSITLPSASQPSSSTSNIIIREDGLQVNHPKKYRVLLPKPTPTIIPVQKLKQPEKKPDVNTLSHAKWFNEEEHSQVEADDYEIPLRVPKREYSNSPEQLSSPPSPVKKFKRQAITEKIDANRDDERPYDQFGKYIAVELRHLPQRQAILLQQELQNCIIRAKLSCLEGVHSTQPDTKEILHVDVPSNSTYSSNDESNDYDVLSQAVITTFGANDK